MSQTHPLTTTAFELPGYRVVRSFGVVRGIMVRSRSIVGNIGASIQSLFGGNISHLHQPVRTDAGGRLSSRCWRTRANWAPTR